MLVLLVLLVLLLRRLVLLRRRLVLLLRRLVLLLRRRLQRRSGGYVVCCWEGCLCDLLQQCSRLSRGCSSFYLTPGGLYIAI
jgi:hypothetical protein